jgi:tetratricopeptide (TPR) repeat protein
MKFGIRIGVNTGEAVAGTEAREQFLVTGPAVVAGARLEQHAKPGEILVGELTRDLTRGSIRFGRRRRISAKGLGFLSAAPALEITKPLPEPERGVAQLRAPMIGRDEEMAALVELHARVTRERKALLVTVIAPAGAGKSRLAREFVERIAQDRIARGRCLPYGDAITLYPLQQILRADAGIESADNLATAAGKLRSLLASVFGDRAEEALAVTARLTIIAGLASAEAALGDVARADIPDELRWATRRYFEARSAERQLVVVFEDVHWAEPALLDLIEHLALADGQLLLLCLARPDLIDRRPGWGAQRRSSQLGLVRLDDDETRQLVAELLAIENLPEQVRAEVVSRAEGNPLFVEEFLRLLIDGGYVKKRGSRWTATRAATSLALPPTVQGLIAARLDQLPAQVKRLVQYATVAGRVVSQDALDALAPGNHPAHLAEAVRRDVLIPSDEASFGGGKTYRFSHVLVRDVAYATLAKSDRLRLHDLFGRWLENVLGDRRDESADVVAYHAEQAHLLSREVIAPQAGSGRRAFEWLMRAGDLAAAREDLRAAMRLFARAAAVAGDAEATPREQFDARAKHELIHAAIEPGPDTEASLDALIRSADALGPSAALVRLLILRGSGFGPAVDEVAAHLDRALELARHVGDPQVVSEALLAAHWVPTRSGQIREAEDRMRTAYEHASENGLTRQAAECLHLLANHTIERGAFTQARDYLAEAERLAIDTGSNIARQGQLMMQQWLCEFAGDSERAEHSGLESLRLAREVGSMDRLLWNLRNRGQHLEEHGRHKESLAFVEEGIELAAASDMPQHVSHLHWTAALACLGLGRIDEAVRHVEQGVASSVPGAWARAKLTIALARICVARGDVARADQLFQEGIEALDRAGFESFTIDTREHYARFLLANQQPDEARRQLERVRAYYWDPLVAHRRAKIDALLLHCEDGASPAIG